GHKHKLEILGTKPKVLELLWNHVERHVRYFKRMMEAVVFTCAFAKPKTRIRVLQEPYEDLQHVYPVLRDSFFRSKFQKGCDEFVVFDVCETGVCLVHAALLGTGEVLYYLAVHDPE